MYPISYLNIITQRTQSEVLLQKKKDLITLMDTIKKMKLIYTASHKRYFSCRGPHGVNDLTP